MLKVVGNDTELALRTPRLALILKKYLKLGVEAAVATQLWVSPIGVWPSFIGGQAVRPSVRTSFRVFDGLWNAAWKSQASTIAACLKAEPLQGEESRPTSPR